MCRNNACQRFRGRKILTDTDFPQSNHKPNLLLFLNIIVTLRVYGKCMIKNVKCVLGILNIHFVLRRLFPFNAHHFQTHNCLVVRLCVRFWLHVVSIISDQDEMSQSRVQYNIQTITPFIPINCLNTLINSIKISINTKRILNFYVIGIDLLYILWFGCWELVSCNHDLVVCLVLLACLWLNYITCSCFLHTQIETMCVHDISWFV